MRAYLRPARPARLLAAPAAGAAVTAALTGGRRGRWSRAAATVVGVLVARRLAGAPSPAGVGTGATRPPPPIRDGPDELRLWVAAGNHPAPARPHPVADPLSS
ncbi:MULTISPECIES: hypothetical protein [Micromonospora]|uniref:Uncharacterized protein n=1 Tax=Micromonospora solifontis TaxID=2487138 RepID=A0ABX9WK86_9ACTN|nr:MULTISPECIES: hypothetical protein [Micromonospora]NES12434.1 hypothetical protein [Micromonospora sp. PPF5-17B]NES36350.1 hypothetical protein [Micromonospora solifontis]NES57804.1 hypothetical protein [Micromonospora sp. PPF5-6]RNL99591.1 hypothetical protein EFE23_09255 [Micromonospora solifontis]